MGKKHQKKSKKRAAVVSVVAPDACGDAAHAVADAVGQARIAAERTVAEFVTAQGSQAVSAAGEDLADAGAAAVRASKAPHLVSESPLGGALTHAVARSVEGAWDLHCHSVFSDGSCTVDELIAQARACGLARLAITDHDTLDQLAFVRERSRALGFPVLAGLEVSARDYHTGRNVHILAFGLEATPDGSGPLEQMVNHTLYQRTANTLWQAWVLQKRDAEFSGRRVSLDDVVRTAGASKGVYKQHLMESLTHRHHNDPDYRFFYQCQLKGDSPANHDIVYPAAPDAVRAVREQGGVAVLAHPGQMNSWGAIPELVAAGLQGIETFHPDHGPVDEELAFEAAARHGLFVTGGSDFHGKYGAPASVGAAFVMPEEAGAAVEELFARETSLS